MPRLDTDSTSAPYSHSDSGQASIPTNVIVSRQRVRALINAAGSLGALPSHTAAPSNATTQIEVVFSETSSPTNRPSRYSFAGPNQSRLKGSEGPGSDYPSSRSLRTAAFLPRIVDRLGETSDSRLSASNETRRHSPRLNAVPRDHLLCLAAAAEPSLTYSIAGFLPLADELDIGHDGLIRMVGPPMRDICFIIGNADHQTRGARCPKDSSSCCLCGAVEQVLQVTHCDRQSPYRQIRFPLRSPAGWPKLCEY